MGIQIEFNPDLALRKYKTPGRSEKECIPEKLEAGKIYDFIKEGQRNYWLLGEIPLRITEGNEKLSPPIASIKILNATHILANNNKVFTKGKYQLIRILNEGEIYFNGLDPVRK